MRVVSPSLLAMACLSACAAPDPRVEAVDSLLEFVTGAPYDVTVEELSEYDHQYLWPAVRTDALPKYNEIFELFAADTLSSEDRTGLYGSLTRSLLYYFPVTSIESVDYEEFADTLRATVAFQRPEQDSYKERVLDWVESHEGKAATPLDQTALSTEFSGRLTRALSQLQSPDTAWISVIAEPRIVFYRTARMLYDSVQVVERRAEMLSNAQEVISSVQFRDLNGSALLSSYLDIEGYVTPRSGLDWYKRGVRDDEAILSGYWVECEGVRGSSSARTAAVLLPRTNGERRQSFDCFWISDDLHELQAIRPTRYQLRLTFRFLGDTIFGDWVQVPR